MSILLELEGIDKLSCDMTRIVILWMKETKSFEVFFNSIAHERFLLVFGFLFGIAYYT